MRIFNVSGHVVNGGNTVTVRHKADGNVETIAFSGLPVYAEGQNVTLGATKLIRQGSLWLLTLPAFTDAFAARLHVEYGPQTWDSDRFSVAIDADDVIAVNDAFTAKNFKAVVDEIGAARGASASLSGALTAMSQATSTNAAQVVANEDNAALWRTSAANPASIFPVPESRFYVRATLVAAQAGANPPSPTNIRAITPALATGQKVEATVTGLDAYTAFTASAPVYGVTGVPDIVDCETGKYTQSARLLALPATGWSDAAFTADGYFSIALTPAAAAAPAVMCSHFAPATSALANDNKIVVAGGTIKVYPGDTVATSLTEWHAWLAANSVDVLYELAAPIITDITPGAMISLPRLTRAAVAENALTVTANGATTAVTSVTITYQKSIIKEADEILAAIDALTP